ncbi:DNA-binding transcriptional LysR family regulator [Paraburkholderia youngii]
MDVARREANRHCTCGWQVRAQHGWHDPQAVDARHGIILMPEEAVSDELASGRLRRHHAGMPWQGTPTPVYAITETRLLPAKTQRFIEFLQERLKR